MEANTKDSLTERERRTTRPPAPNQQHCSEDPVSHTACRRESVRFHSALSDSQECCDATPVAHTIAVPWHRRYVESPWMCRLGSRMRYQRCYSWNECLCPAH